MDIMKIMCYNNHAKAGKFNFLIKGEKYEK